MLEPDILLCQIIAHELELDDDRVVVYNQDWDPPKDEGLYIVVSTRSIKPLHVSSKFDDETYEEVMHTVSFDNLDIDITSKNREAIERKEEVLMALTSFYSTEQQELNSVKIFRTGNILDLSFIEAASAMHRFRIPVIMSNIKEKRKASSYYDKFRNEGIIER